MCVHFFAKERLEEIEEVIMTTLFFELIQVALGNRICLSRIPSKQEWGTLYMMAKNQAVLGVCFIALQSLAKHHQLENLSVKLRSQWLGAVAMIQAKNELMNVRCLELQDRLTNDGFRTCILKGQGVAALYFSPLGQYRQPGDIDVYVDCDRKDVLVYLRRIGLVYNSWDYIHTQPNFFSDADVELHYRPSVVRNLMKNRKLQRFFKENKDEFFIGKETMVNDKVITVPSNWMNIFYVLHHTNRHMFSDGIGMRQVMDCYMLISNISLSSREIQMVSSAIKMFGMERFVSGLIWVMQEVFDSEGRASVGLDNFKMFQEHFPPEEKDGHFILGDIMHRGNFGQMDERYGNTHSNKLKKVIGAFRRSLHLLSHYPSDALWTPVYYIWHFCWKKIVGLHYLPT